MQKQNVVDIIALSLIVLFGYASINKLMDYTRFVHQIGRSAILKGLSGSLAWIIPATELLVCAMLIIPRWKTKGLAASVILMAAFTIYIAAILLWSEHIPCSCGGILSQMGWRTHLVFNVFFTGVALTGYMLDKKNKFLSPDREGALKKVAQQGAVFP